MAYASTERAPFGWVPEPIGRRLDDLRRRGIEPLVNLEPRDSSAPGQAAFFGNEPTVGGRLGYLRAGYTRVFYIQSGGGTVHVGRRSVTLKRGDLLLIPPYHRSSLHDFRPTRADCKITHFWYFGFRAGPVFLSDRKDHLNGFWPADPLAAFPILEGTEARVGRIPGPAQAMWVDQCAELAAEMNGAAPGREEKIRALSTLMVVEARRFNARSGTPLVPNDSVTLTIFRFINANADRSITTAEIAAAVGRSSCYIRDLVRRETGRSLGEWIEERRMRWAAQRLIRGGEQSVVTALGLGSEDLVKFAKKFHAWSGVSPDAFSAMHRGAYSSSAVDGLEVPVFLLSELLQRDR